MTKKNYPSPSELDSKREELLKLESAQRTMDEMGIPASPELLQKINEVSSQTRKNLPKWVTDPKWIDQLEDLKESLLQALKNLKGSKGTKKQIASLNAQLEKVNKVLNEPKDYLPEGMSRKAYALENTGNVGYRLGNFHANKLNEMLEILNARELSQKEIKTTLKDFEGHHEYMMKLDVSVDWKSVKASLLSNPEAIKSLYLMELFGHVPQLYREDENYYYIGSFPIGSPITGRHTTYKDAESRAKEMGVILMPPDHYKDFLQNVREVQKLSSSNLRNWLLTSEEDLSKGKALVGYSVGEKIDYHQADSRMGELGWLGSLRVKKV